MELQGPETHFEGSLFVEDLSKVSHLQKINFWKPIQELSEVFFKQFEYLQP